MEAAVATQEFARVETAGVIQVVSECRGMLERKYRNPYGKRVLELGVGPETMMDFLGNTFGEKVFRMDLGDWNARNNKINAGQVQGEMQSLPIASKSVDVVVLLKGFDNKFDLGKAIGEIERILNTGGEAIMMIPEQFLKDGKPDVETGLTVSESKCIGINGEAGPCWVIALGKK